MPKPDVTEMGRRRAAELIPLGHESRTFTVSYLAEVLANFGVQVRAADEATQHAPAPTVVTCDPRCGGFVGDPDRNNRRFYSVACMHAERCLNPAPTTSVELVEIAEKIRQLAAGLVSDLYTHEVEVQRLRDQVTSAALPAAVLARGCGALVKVAGGFSARCGSHFGEQVQLPVLCLSCAAKETT